jgi:hypothetical protein
VTKLFGLLINVVLTNLFVGWRQNNVVSFAFIVVLKPPLFAANVVSRIALKAVSALLVCRSLHLSISGWGFLIAG